MWDKGDGGDEGAVAQQWPDKGDRAGNSINFLELN